MTEARGPIDWQAAYARLEQARRAIEAGGALPPEEIERILRARAAALAKPVAEAPTPTGLLDLLVFSLAGERYAIETSHVLEVVPLRDLTPVPCTPPFVLGVVNHRGRILPVLDLRRLLDLGGQGAPEGSQAVVVEAGGMTFGVFADLVVDTTRLGSSELAPPAPTLTGRRQAFLRGVTGEMVAVLDLEGLARDRRIVVDDETV